MGVGTETRSNKTWLTVWGGKIVEKLKEGGTIHKSPKDESKTVRGNIYDYISGMISNLYVQNNDYDGNQWSDLTIEMYDPSDATVFVLRVPFKSGYARQFLNRLKSIDFSKEVKLATYYFQNDEDKWISVMNVLQGGEGNWNKVASAHTKEEPNGLPEVVQAQVGNKTVWDDSDRVQFYMNVIKDEVLPQLPAGKLGQKAMLAPKNDYPVRIDYEALLGKPVQAPARVADSIEANEGTEESMAAQDVSDADLGKDLADETFPDPITDPDNNDDLPF